MKPIATMAAAKDVFERYVAELERHDVPYVILHSYEDFPERFASDVDYAVPDSELPRVWDIQAAVAAQCGWVLALTIRHQSCAYHTVLINPNDPTEYLQLDVCSHYLSHGCRLVRDRDLLEGRKKYKGFHVPSASSEFIYRVARLLMKKKEPSEHLPGLRALWEEDRERAAQLWTSLLGTDAGSFEDWAQRPGPEWSRLRARMISRNHFNLFDRLREYRRLLYRIAHPIGSRVAILGSDGAGKSTLLPQIEPLLRPCMRGHKTVHFRPSALEAPTSIIVTEPHAQPPRSTPASWLKIFYYFFDCWLGFCLREFPGSVRGVCTIYDRHFDDMLVDSKRYRLQHSAPLVRLLRRALPKMDLTIVLDASPEVLHQRKPELTLEELQRQRSVLRELAASQPSSVIVSAEQPADAVARDAARSVILALGEREKRRAALCS